MTAKELWTREAEYSSCSYKRAIYVRLTFSTKNIIMSRPGRLGLYTRAFAINIYIYILYEKTPNALY